MSVRPEPNPFPGTKEILPELLRDIQIKAESGQVKYGTLLQTNNGRRALADLYQELIDACFYIKQELMEREESNVSAFFEYLDDAEKSAGVDRLLSNLQDVGPLMTGHRLVHGARGDNYGHPYEDFGRTADAVTAFLGNKLNAPIEPEDIALIMLCVKLSREMNKPKPDNLTDAAGYIETWWMVKKVKEYAEQTGQMPDLQQPF